MTRPQRPRAQSRPRVFLHIGEPKTGTTFLQQLMWANRSQLAARGVLMPGTGSQSVFRAVQDLRGVHRRPDDPAMPWSGEWDRLAREALGARRSSVISHELLCAVDDRQAAHAVASLAGAEVHVILTVRDVASVLPAEWQESVKHRSTRGWDDWLGDVIDKESQVEDRRQFWFWRVHDTHAILQSWAAVVPASQIHVLTVPRSGAAERGASGELWRRFASVIGATDDLRDTGAARSNSSLGLAEVELLRRLNSALAPSVPDWFYMWNVKEPLAHGILAQRPPVGRLRLPAERESWARAHATELIDSLAASSYDVVGDLDDLRPQAGDPAAPHPGDVTDEELLDAAVAATAALIEGEYHRGHRSASRPFVFGETLLTITRSSPAVHRSLHRLSERNSWIRALRTALRHRIERAREPA